MGKSSKKSALKVEAAPAVVAPTAAKKGKREAENTPEKQVASKKQKKNDGVAQAVQREKVEAMTQKKKKIEESSSSDDSSDSEDEKRKQPAATKNGSFGVPAKKGKQDSSSDSSDSGSEDSSSEEAAPKKQLPVTAKNGSIKAPANKGKQASSSDSDSDDLSSDEELAVKKPVAAKNVSVGAPSKNRDPASSSDSSSDDSDSDEEPDVKAKQVGSKNGPTSASVKKGRHFSTSDGSFKSDSSSEEDTSSDEDKKKSELTSGVHKGPSTIVKMQPEESSLDDTSSESDEDETCAKVVPTTAKNVPVTEGKREPSDSDSSDEDSVEENVKKVTTPAPKKEADSDTSSSDETESEEEEAPPPKATVSAKRSLPTGGSKQSKQESDESEYDSSESDESDDEPAMKKPKVEANAGKAVAKVVQDDSSSGEEESSDDDEENDDEEASKPKKNGTELEMVDAATPKNRQFDSKHGKKTPQTPTTPQGQSTGSKTLFVGNLPYQVERADVEEFFKDVGEIVDIRFSTDAEGNFKGFGHVEFATEEAAQKAVDELSGQSLMNRTLRLDFARERGAYTPFSGKENNSFQKGGRGQAQTVFVRGFDATLGEVEVRSALEEHFVSCGDITRIAIPVDRESGAIKGYAYLDFKDGDSFNKALELDGTELKNHYLTVEEAKPKGDFRDSAGGGRGGRGGGRSAGGRSGGRSGGRDGGRGGRRGGGRGGGRGRGTPKPNLVAAGIGKKTTFGDDE